MLRQHSSVPVTTNLMVTAHIQTQNYFSWAPELDLIANDHYLDHRLPDPIAELAFSADLTRGLAGGKPWMVMETSTSAVSWQPVNHAKREGELVRTVLGHIARGADSMCFFQWRASRSGAEKFHSALLPHGGTAGTGWAQSLELSGLLDRLSPVVGSTVHARAALVFSWESWWAAEGDSHPSSLLRYLTEAHRYHRALRALGITVDMVAPGTDVSSYDLVVAPTLYSVTDAAALAIAEAANAGATVVITPFTGIVDEHDAVIAGGYPGAFRDLLGLTIDEFRPLSADVTVTLSTGARGSIWTDAVRVTGADIVATYSDGPAAASPAITRRSVGSGSAWYVGTVLDDDGLLQLLRELADTAGLPIVEVGYDVDIVTRRSATDDFTFIINHRSEPIAVPYAGLDLVSGETVSDATPLPAGAVRVVISERSDRGA